MELHKAIKEIVAIRGAGMINNVQIINYLLDYQAFKEKPATKLILRDIINSGYSEEILTLNTNETGWQTKFKQYQHEFIDSCGYKEELANYVFESIAYGLGLVLGNREPEIQSSVDVDSFFNIHEEPEEKQKAVNQPQASQNVSSTDLYTIALSFYTEGKYQMAKGFIEKALANPLISLSQHFKLMGDIQMKLGHYEEAIKYYNESFVRKAKEKGQTTDALREALKAHKVKGFENSMLYYYYCLYSLQKLSKTQWEQFVKAEARFGVMDAIKYCADNGINPIEDHFDIYFTDKGQLKTGDYLYDDGSFAHENSTTKKVIAKVVLSETSDYEKSQGWTHGYLIPMIDMYKISKYNINGNINLSYYIKNGVAWSTQYEDMSFPHTHYTVDDLNHWKEIDTVESEQFIKIKSYDDYPVFKAIQEYQKQIQIPISGTSQWFLPSIHTVIRCRVYYFDYSFKSFWTSSQSDAKNAISFERSFSVDIPFTCTDKKMELAVQPVAAF